MGVLNEKRCNRNIDKYILDNNQNPPNLTKKVEDNIVKLSNNAKEQIKEQTLKDKLIKKLNDLKIDYEDGSITKEWLIDQFDKGSHVPPRYSSSSYVQFGAGKKRRKNKRRKTKKKSKQNRKKTKRRHYSARA